MEFQSFDTLPDFSNEHYIFPLTAENRSERVRNNLFIHLRRKEERICGRPIIIAETVIAINVAYCHIPALNTSILFLHYRNYIKSLSFFIIHYITTYNV